MSTNKRPAWQTGRLSSDQLIGVTSVVLSTFFLGWAPIIGKLAYQANVLPYTLAAGRTLLAAGLLWLTYFLLPAWRRCIFISRHDLMNCLAIGSVNGVGSLFFYTGLSRIDASLASLLNTLYPLWVLVFLGAAGQPLKRFTMLRLLLAGFGIALLTQAGDPQHTPDLLGIMMLLAASAAYAWNLVMGQWVLADVPANSVTLYVLSAMAAVVCVARLAQSTPLEPISLAGWSAITGLGVVTALSRLTMFLGLRRLGGVQTALIGLLELLITLLLAFLVLGERLSSTQWIGGAFLALAIGLVSRDVGPSLSSEEWIAELEQEAEKAIKDWQDWKEKQQNS